MADEKWKSIEICKTEKDRFDYLKYAYLKTHGLDSETKIEWDNNDGTVIVKTVNDNDNTEVIQIIRDMMNKINADFYKNSDLCISTDYFDKYQDKKMEIQDSLDSPVHIKEDIKRSRDTVVVEIMGWDSGAVSKVKQQLEHDLGIKRKPTKKRAGRIFDESQETSIRDPEKDQDNSETADRNRFHTYEEIDVFIHQQNIEDWTEVDCCIVNPTDEDFKPKGGVSIALLKKGGSGFEEQLEIVRSEGHTSVGECRMSLAGSLHVSKVIHLVCPSTRFSLMVISERKCKENIFKSVFNCMKEADENNLTSIVFPFIYTGKLARPVTECCLQYAYAILEYSRNTDAKTRSLKKVSFVCNSQDHHNNAMTVFRRTIPSDYGQLFRIIEEVQPYEIVAVHRQNEPDVVKQNFDNQSIAESGDGPEHADSPIRMQKQEKAAYSTKSAASRRSSGYTKPINIKTHSVIEKFGGKIEVVFVNNDIRETQVTAIVCPIGSSENEDKVNGNELTGSYIKAAYHATFSDSQHENKRQILYQQKTTKKFVSVTKCLEDDDTGRKAKYLYHVVLPVYENTTKYQTFEDRMNKALDALLNRVEQENKSKKSDVREMAFPLFGLNDMLDVDTVKTVCGTIAKCLHGCVSNRENTKHLMTKIYIVNKCSKVMSIFEDAFTEVHSQVHQKSGRKSKTPS